MVVKKSKDDSEEGTNSSHIYYIHRFLDEIARAYGNKDIHRLVGWCKALITICGCVDDVLENMNNMYEEYLKVGDKELIKYLNKIYDFIISNECITKYIKLTITKYERYIL